MSEYSVSNFMNEASAILREQYPKRLKWVEGQLALANSGPIHETAQNTSRALNAAMWAWNDASENYIKFLEAVITALNDASALRTRQSAFWEAQEADPDLLVRQMALAMRQYLLTNEENVSGVIDLFKSVVSLGLAFGVAGLANTISREEQPRLKLILSRLPQTAKEIGASAVLGPVKDAIELGFDLFEPDRSEEHEQESALKWHARHENLTKSLELWAAQFNFMSLLLVKNTVSIESLIPSTADV